jgi:dihydroxy-acid dehydratase
LKDGDIIEIDVDNFSINVELSPEEIEERRRNFKPIKKELKSRWLKQYRALVTNASNGAILKGE